MRAEVIQDRTKFETYYQETVQKVTIAERNFEQKRLSVKSCVPKLKVQMVIEPL